VAGNKGPDDGHESRDVLRHAVGKELPPVASLAQNNERQDGRIVELIISLSLVADSHAYRSAGDDVYREDNDRAGQLSDCRCGIHQQAKYGAEADRV
jgi:hypothetical protein